MDPGEALPRKCSPPGPRRPTTVLDEKNNIFFTGVHKHRFLSTKASRKG